MPPPFSIIITTHNRPRLLARCLTSILAQTYPLNLIEIVVVDDGSRAQTARVVAAFAEYAPIIYLRQAQQGWGAARRVGVQHSQHATLVFLDDDCIAPPNWLTHYARAYTRWPEAGGIGGGLRPGARMNVAGHKQFHGHQAYFNRLNAPLGITFEHAGRAWFTFGGNRTFRREIWLIAQPHADDHPWAWYFDDTRIDLSLRELGIPIYYNPTAWIYHHYHLSIEQRIRAAYRYGRSEHDAPKLSDDGQIASTAGPWKKWRQINNEYGDHSWRDRGWYALTQPMVWLARRWGQYVTQHTDARS